MGKRKRDWGPLLEQADGKPRGPIAGVRNHRLPDLETLLAIDAAAEAEAARQQRGIAGPDVARGELAVVEATPRHETVSAMPWGHGNADSLTGPTEHDYGDATCNGPTAGPTGFFKAAVISAASAGQADVAWVRRRRFGSFCDRGAQFPTPAPACATKAAAQLRKKKNAK